MKRSCGENKQRETHRKKNIRKENPKKINTRGGGGKQKRREEKSRRVTVQTHATKKKNIHTKKAKYPRGKKETPLRSSSRRKTQTRRDMRRHGKTRNEEQHAQGSRVPVKWSLSGMLLEGAHPPSSESLPRHCPAARYLRSGMISLSSGLFYFLLLLFSCARTTKKRIVSSAKPHQREGSRKQLEGRGGRKKTDGRRCSVPVALETNRRWNARKRQQKLSPTHSEAGHEPKHTQTHSHTDA